MNLMFFVFKHTCEKINVIHMLVNILQAVDGVPVHHQLHLLPGFEPAEAALLPPDVVGREAVVPASLDVE